MANESARNVMVEVVTEGNITTNLWQLEGKTVLTMKLIGKDELECHFTDGTIVTFCADSPFDDASIRVDQSPFGL